MSCDTFPRPSSPLIMLPHTEDGSGFACFCPLKKKSFKINGTWGKLGEEGVKELKVRGDAVNALRKRSSIMTSQPMGNKKGREENGEA